MQYDTIQVGQYNTARSIQYNTVQAGQDPDYKVGPAAVTPAVTILYAESASRCYLLLSAPIGAVVVLELAQRWWC